MTPITTTSTTTDDSIPPTTEITTKSTIEIELATPNATDDGLREHGEHERDRQRRARATATTFWPTSVSSRRDSRNVPAWIAVPSRLPRRAEDVAAHADRGRDEDEQAGQRLERAGDRAERQPGEKVPARREQERDEPRPDPARVGANNGDEAPEEARASDHLLLGGSLIGIRLVGMGRLTLTADGPRRGWGRLTR